LTSKIFLILVLSVYPLFCFSQNSIQLLEPKSVYLTGQSYNLSFKSEKDSISPIVIVKKGHLEITLSDARITFPESGRWRILHKDDEITTLWVVPGWLSITPPLIAIILALLTRQVLMALFSGIFFGSFIIFSYNPFAGFFYTFTEFIVKAPADVSHASILIFSMVLGGMVGVISKSGGTQGIVEQLAKYASNSKKGQLITWFMGILIFFDDYANTLIVGNTMRPLTDKLKISREKLSYLVDSTAAPIATLAIISTWIGYQLSLIDQSFQSLGIEKNPFVVFIQTIPFSFYPIFTLIFGFFIAVTGRDYGAMYKAEKRAKDFNKVLDDTAVPLMNIDENLLADEKTPLRWYNALIPVAVVIITTIGGLWITGIQAAETYSGTSTLAYISTVIGNADSYKVLIWGSFLGSLTAIVLAVSQKLLSLNDSLMAWVNGIKSLLMACIILTLAWSIGDICTRLQTADWVISSVSGFLSPHWIPAVAFITAGVIAFSTGTSWATMAVLTPIVIPLAYHLPGAEGTIDLATQSTIFISSIAAILSGATFGDHCSPISDTTIMSSMASGSDHIDHVRTQMPYALTTGLISILLGFIPAGFGISGYWDVIAGGIIIYLIIRLLGRKV
jgi:Na+/H+ antiporter NhaC